MRTFINPGDEAPALRRAAVLLERIRQDEGNPADFAELEAGVAAMQRAAAAGRLVHHSALERMLSTLARLAPQSCARGAKISEIVRCNALTETRELLGRLARAKPAPAGAPRHRAV